MIQPLESNNINHDLVTIKSDNIDHENDMVTRKKK